jgi:hypothetical protein
VLSDSAQYRRNLAQWPNPTITVGFRRPNLKNLGTFGDRFKLQKNSNGWRWQISTNVCTRIKSLNLKIINHFSKIEDAFWVKLKIIFVDYHFQLHQISKKKKKKKKKKIYAQKKEPDNDSQQLPFI